MRVAREILNLKLNGTVRINLKKRLMSMLTETEEADDEELEYAEMAINKAVHVN